MSLLPGHDYIIMDKHSEESEIWYTWVSWLLWTEFCPPEIHVEVVTAHVTVLGGGAFWRGLGTGEVLGPLSHSTVLLRGEVPHLRIKPPIAKQ